MALGLGLLAAFSGFLGRKRWENPWEFHIKLWENHRLKKKHCIQLKKNLKDALRGVSFARLDSEVVQSVLRIFAGYKVSQQRFYKHEFAAGFGLVVCQRKWRQHTGHNHLGPY